MSFVSTFPANAVKLMVPGVTVPIKVRRYIWVCNTQLIYAELEDIIDPSNHRHIYDALTCTANNIISWINMISSTIGGAS